MKVIKWAAVALILLVSACGKTNTVYVENTPSGELRKIAPPPPPPPTVPNSWGKFKGCSWAPYPHSYTGLLTCSFEDFYGTIRLYTMSIDNDDVKKVIIIRK